MAGTTSKTLVRLAAFAKAMLAVAMFAAASASGSAAMLAQMVHSMAGAISLGLLAFGLAKSGTAAQPVDRREAIFWGYVVGTMVMSLAAGVAIVLGVQRWQVPEAITVESLPFFVLAAAAATEFGFAHAARAEHRRRLAADPGFGDDPALRTILLQGYCAPAGLVAAAGGLVTIAAFDHKEIDGIAAILVGLIIGTAAALLAFEVRSILRDALLTAPAATSLSPRTVSEDRVSTVDAPSGGKTASRISIVEASAGSVLEVSIAPVRPPVGAAAPPSVTFVETPSSSLAPLTETGKGAAEIAPFRQPITGTVASSYPPPKRGKNKKKR